MKLLHYIFLFSINFSISAQNNFSKYNDEAYYHYQQNDIINAIKKYSKALEYKSEVSNSYKIADTYINRGLCREMLMSFENAQADYDEALKVKPEYLKIYQMKSSAFLRANKFQYAIDWANKGLELKPNDFDLKHKKAEGLSRIKKYDEAITVLRTILTENPRNKKANKFIGHNYQLKKNWDSALKYFSTAILLDPLDHASFFDRGLVYGELKDSAKAIKDIQHGMTLDTNERSTGYNNIGYFIKLQQKDYQGAIDMFTKAIELRPDFSYAYNNRAFAKLQLGNLKGAYQDVKKSLSIDNKNPYAYKNLALIYLKDNKKSDACYNLKKALENGYTEREDDEVEKLLAENCK